MTLFTYILSMISAMSAALFWGMMYEKYSRLRQTMTRKEIWDLIWSGR